MNRERKATPRVSDADGTGEPFVNEQPRIADRCPSCGTRSLFIGAGGWLTCGVIGCKEPGVSAAWEVARKAEAEARAEQVLVAWHQALVTEEFGPGRASGQPHESLARIRRALEVERARVIAALAGEQRP